jgi:hypothetical protein
MTTATASSDAARFTCEGGRWYVSIPWKKAEELRERLQGFGCPTVLCLDPTSQEARLELQPGVDPDRMLAVLEGIGGSRPAPEGV